MFMIQHDLETDVPEFYHLIPVMLHLRPSCNGGA